MNEVPRRDDTFSGSTTNVSIRSQIIDHITIADIFQKLWRQKVWIFGTIVVVTFFSWIVIQQLTPLYTASTQVMIGAREEKVIDVERVLAGISPDRIMIESEVYVIRSRGIVGKTVDELGLVYDPEFNRHCGRPTFCIVCSTFGRICRSRGSLISWPNRRGRH